MGRSEAKTTWRVGTLNVHSLMNKTAGVLTHLEEKECDVCLVQETYLKSTDTAKIQEIRDNGWNIYSSPRAARSGGGIGVLFRDGVRVKLSPMRRGFQSFQVQEVLVGGNGDLVRLCNVYRPPYTGKARFTEASFLEEFTEYLSDLATRTGSPFLMGDFNFQIQDTSNFYTRKLLSLLDSMGYDQLVPSVPTHIRGGTLDLVICQSEDRKKVQSMSIFPEGTMSDHFLVLTDLVIGSEDCDYKTRAQVSMYRDFKAVSPETFRKALYLQDVTCIQSAETPTDALKAYEEVMEGLVEAVFPMKRVKKHKKMRPWRNNTEVREALRIRRQAERAWEKNRTPLTKKRYNDLKRHFGRVEKEARMKFLKDDLEESKDDARGLQRKLNRLLGKVETVLPEAGCNQQLAEDFAEFFSNKVEKIRTSVSKEKDCAMTSGNAVNTLNSDGQSTLEVFEEVSIEQLKRLVKGMADKSCDLDTIPTWLVKECIDDLAPHLQRIVNLSLQCAQVPVTLQQALVFPTIKNAHGDRDSLNNYRPVSNLPFISKLLEKVALEQITSYLDDHDLLNRHQSGYRVGHSCETLLLGMFEDLLRELDQGNVVALLLLDMSAAFDTVDHSKLLDVLHYRFGFGGTVLQWIESYLQSRCFRVNVRGELSKIIHLICGVPQGSLLGPILFLLYVEELQDLVEPYGLKIKLYADDSQLYLSLVPTDEEGWIAAKEKIEDCLRRIKQWMVDHWLKCNESKTEFLLLGKGSSLEKLSFCPSLDFGGSELLPMKCSGSVGKTLGFLLDENLTLERQVNSVKRQCGLILKNLWQVNRCLDFRTKVLLVKQLVISRLDYCNILYNGLPKKLIVRLQKTLNSCVRFIYNLQGHQEDYTPYLKETHILPIEKRIEFKACLTAYKIVWETAPEDLQDRVPMDDEIDNGRSMRSNATLDRLKLRYPKFTSLNAKSRLRKRQPSVFLPDLWNQLPLSLRSLESVTDFKAQLKTRLFVEAFGED